MVNGKRAAKACLWKTVELGAGGPSRLWLYLTAVSDDEKEPLSSTPALSERNDRKLATRIDVESVDPPWWEWGTKQNSARAPLYTA